jgi:hypothetical protein
VTLVACQPEGSLSTHQQPNQTATHGGQFMEPALIADKVIAEYGDALL